MSYGLMQRYEGLRTHERKSDISFSFCSAFRFGICYVILVETMGGTCIPSSIT